MAAVGSNEDQQYLEKVRQLGRFIEPLTRLIGRYGDEDSEKLSKMKIMLDILSNPNKRMAMDILLKCEAVLEKMDFKRVSELAIVTSDLSTLLEIVSNVSYFFIKLLNHYNLLYA